MPNRRLRAAAGALSCLAVLLLPAVPALPAAAAPPGPAGQRCPETRAQLPGKQFTTADKLPDLTCADLHGAVFDGLDLAQVDMHAADLRGASFRHTDLTQAEFTHADLRDTHFEHADLGQAQLDGVDARGAHFGHADLTQADLNSSDLRGADLVTASMIQADLSEADLRGAKIWFTNSIQADTGGARVDLTDPGSFQLSLLAIVLGLVLLVRSALAVSRGRAAGNGLRRGIVRAVIFMAVGGFVWLIAGMLLALQFVVVAVPLLIGVALAFLSGLVHSLGRRAPAPPPHAMFGPATTTPNPWS